MSCKFCHKACMSACLPLEQVRVKSFPAIFDPAFTREKQARGYACVVKAFQLKGYEPHLLDSLHAFAIKASHRKTVARALEMLDDPFIVGVAQEMASKAFKIRESKHAVLV